MPAQVKRFSGSAIIALSLTALIAVVSGYFQPPQPDEGAAAHIFQLSIVALVPLGLIFFATADWKRPLRTERRLALPPSSFSRLEPSITLNTTDKTTT
jgi:membrane protein DedA with SNARE-associated domain